MFIELQHVDLGFGGPLLLEHIDLVIEPGTRVCVLGRNGCGKSSLLKLLAGKIAPDEGIRRVMPGIRIGILPQETRNSGDDYHDGTALDIATGGQPGIETATFKMLDRLGVDPDAVFNTLSGGLKRRTLLARALSGHPDLLLLDEPTNHLDPDTIEWLEKWLAKPGLSVIFISHDRRFMERVASEVIELDRGCLHHGRMGYRRYLEQREARLEDEERAQARFQKKLSEEETWIRMGIKARRTRNEGRVRRLKAMREQQRNYRTKQANSQATIQGAEKSGKIVLEMDNVSFSYADQPVISDFSCKIMRGDRIGIIGVNGSGKTTLINLMLGRLKPDSGTLNIGTKVEIAEFDQHRSHLKESLCAADNVSEGRTSISTATGERHIISYMQDFLFTPAQSRAPITRLSGGERARLMLARLFSRPFNLLVMDEPTNDLDIETLELLEDTLTNYEGTLLLVSHDRAFLDNVTTSIIHLDGGKAEEYSGGYAEYERIREQQAGGNAGKEKQKSRQSKDIKPQSATKLSYKLKHELEQLPSRIERLESEVEDIHQRMTDSAFYSQPQDVIASVTRMLEIKEAELSKAYNRWEDIENSGQ